MNQIRTYPFGTALGGLLLAGTASVLSCQKQTQIPPPLVYTQAATQQDVPVVMELVGQTSGSQDIEIRARVEGFLQSIAYKEGATVQKGELLFTIDPRDLQAAAQQAQANLDSAQARLRLADVEVNRLKPLAEAQAVSRQSYDQALAGQETSKAGVESARAALDRARLNLSYTRVNAPASGLAGFAQVKPGNLVGSGNSTLLTTISIIDPTDVVIGMQEADYLDLVGRIAKGQASKDVRKTTPATLILADGSTYPLKGHFDAVQRSVDPRTGTLSVRVTFPNPGRVLRPGLFAKVRFDFDVLKDAVMVPQAAVQELQGSYQLLLVGKDGKVELRSVRMGPKYKDLWVVSEGLKAGETVIAQGLQGVKPGVQVRVEPYSTALKGGQ